MPDFQKFDRTASDLIRTLEVDGGFDAQRGLDFSVSNALEHAINTALALGRPLLVSGETGCGKTELGFAIARKLGIMRVRFFVVKSDSEAQRLFYEYDAIRRFHAAQSAPTNLEDEKKGGDATDPRKFIRYHALGQAIIDASPPDLVRPLLPQRYELPQEPVRSVVIIDEIDKAPRDFPNDLLNEIDQLWFRVPELADWVTVPETPRAKIPASLRPMIVITSNLERQLPDAFLRRCVFHHIKYPIEEEIQRRIILGHLTKNFYDWPMPI